MNSATTKVYTTQFILLCASHALFAASFNMMLPELPAYLDAMGGGEHKGLIIALFTITAGLSRPFSGKLADTVGRLPVMYVGTFACVICSLLYPQLTFVGGFLILRFFHGFSTGFKPTGNAAYVADIVPPTRRGEAMGWLGISMSLGASASAPIGSWLAHAHSMNTMFYVSAVLAILSVLMLFQLPESLPNPKPLSWDNLKLKKEDLFDPLVWPVVIVMIGCYVSYGVILTLVPDLCDKVGISNRGIPLAIFTLASVTMRFFAGRISDRIGRPPVLKVSTLFIATAMALFAFADSANTIYFASVIFGFGNGIFSPAINAWTIDLGHENFKGRAIATMYIALEIAIGGGAALAGWYYANKMENIPAVFLWASGMAVAAGLYLLIFHGKKKALAT